MIYRRSFALALCRAHRRGVTLAEVTVSLGILGFLAALVAWLVFGLAKQTKEITGEGTIDSLRVTMQTYGYTNAGFAVSRTKPENSYFDRCVVATLPCNTAGPPRGISLFSVDGQQLSGPPPPPQTNPARFDVSGTHCGPLPSNICIFRVYTTVLAVCPGGLAVCGGAGLPPPDGFFISYTVELDDALTDSNPNINLSEAGVPIMQPRTGTYFVARQFIIDGSPADSPDPSVSSPSPLPAPSPFPPPAPPPPPPPPASSDTGATDGDDDIAGDAGGGGS